MGVCERSIRRYIAAGRLSSRRLPGGHYRIAPEAIAEFWRAHEQRVAAGHRARTGAPARTPPARAPLGAGRSRAPRLGASTRREFDLSDEHLARLRERHLSKALQGSGVRCE
jgi:hypothetical protein